MFYQKYLQNVILPLENLLNNAFGIPPVDTPYEIDDMYDCVQAHACHNYNLPPGLTQDLYDDLVEQNIALYAGLGFSNHSNSSFNFMQIAMGAFVNEVTMRIAAASKGSSEKFALFSGHDTTLLPFLMAYGYFDGVWPPYASMIRIELLDGGKGILFACFTTISCL